jgi:hypothetical protein
MIKTDKNIIAGLLIGLAVIFSFVFFQSFFQKIDTDCSDNQNLRLTVYNQDLNRSHTINVSVYNSSRHVMAGYLSEIVPGNGSTITFHPVCAGEKNYSVTFIVDGSISSHFEKIASSHDCTESFYLESTGDVIRPYLLWC